jgi:hypothetical protein
MAPPDVLQSVARGSKLGVQVVRHSLNVANGSGASMQRSTSEEVQMSWPSAPGI